MAENKGNEIPNFIASLVQQNYDNYAATSQSLIDSYRKGEMNLIKRALNYRLSPDVMAFLYLTVAMLNLANLTRDKGLWLVFDAICTAYCGGMAFHIYMSTPAPGTEEDKVTSIVKLDD